MAIPITLNVKGAKNQTGAKISNRTIPRTLPNKKPTHITSNATPATINANPMILDINQPIQTPLFIFQIKFQTLYPVHSVHQKVPV